MTLGFSQANIMCVYTLRNFGYFPQELAWEDITEAEGVNLAIETKTVDAAQRSATLPVRVAGLS